MMDNPRPLASEPTQILPDSLPGQQPPTGEAVFPALGALPSGTEIAGRYQVLAELSGFGGEADVFSCRDKETDQKVAVKVYRTKLSPKEDILQILLNIKHNNLIRLLAFGTWNNRFFEVMEYAAGGALTEGMPYSEDFIRKIFIPQALEGMNFLHDHNIIHRDLKPANLFFRDKSKSEVVIADYGASSLLQVWEGSVHQSGSLKGTIDYAAPEAFSGHFGKEADYYSLGIALLVLLTGDSPFTGMSEPEKMRHHLTERILPPEKCSKPFTDLIAGLLCKERRRRWGYDQLRDWLQGKPVPVPDFVVAGFSYTLANGRAHTTKELGELMLKNPEEAKKHLRKRLIYDEIKKTDQSLASAIDDIQSESANIDECLVGTIYTLNPELPYTFIEGAEIRTPRELARLIDRNEATWAAGREQLYNGMIPAWLRAIGYGKLAEEWKKVADKFSAP